MADWIETTGATVDEAKDRALEALGVDAEEAEFEVIEEPKPGLFGRTRGQGRVRARVLPVAPPPKQDQRRRRGKSDGGDAASAPAPATAAPTETGAAEPSSPDSGRNNGRSRRDRPERGERTPMPGDQQQEILEAFYRELLASFGVEATVTSELVDGVLTVDVAGADGTLGRLIGPRLQTLDALQEIGRNVLQRHAGDMEYAKVVLEVGGARQLRRDALAEFVRTSVERLRDEGGAAVFEVMNSADRKVVHDTVSELEGVSSTSEGEDPRRRVVITAS